MNSKPVAKKPVKKQTYPGPASDMLEWKGLLYFKPARITQRVWIGSERDAADPAFIKKHGFKLIVNCTADIPRYSAVQMLRVPVNDSSADASKMAKYLAITSSAIRDVTRYGGNVLVHCRAGQNRSATVVAAYLMTIKGISAADAMKIIRAKKFNTFRPMNFLPALKLYERKLVENGVIKPKKNVPKKNNKPMKKAR